MEMGIKLKICFKTRDGNRKTVYARLFVPTVEWSPQAHLIPGLNIGLIATLSAIWLRYIHLVVELVKQSDRLDQQVRLSQTKVVRQS